MSSENKVFYDFSHIVAEEIEVESTELTENHCVAGNPSKEKPQKAVGFEPADYHNGAIYEDLNYSWSQTFTEIGNDRIDFSFYRLICIG